MLRKLIVFLGIVYCMTLGGCSSWNKVDGSIIQRETRDDSVSYNETLYHSENMINTMEMLSNSNLFLMTSNEEGDFFVNFINESEMWTKELEDYYPLLSYDDNTESLFAYNQSQGRIEEKNKEFQTIQVLVDGFRPFEIKDMDLLNDGLYALCVIDEPVLNDEYLVYDDNDGYVDYGEILYKINLNNGKMENMKIKGIISFFKADADDLYLYVHRDDSYYLDKLNISTGKVVCSFETKDVGYVFSFAVYDNIMYYTGMTANGICAKNLETGELIQKVHDVFTYQQSDFEMMKDCLVFLDRYNMDVCTLKMVTGKDEDGLVKFDENVDLVIGFTDMYNLPYSYKELEKLSGMNIKTYESPIVSDSSFNQTLMNKLLNNDSDVDIYILSISNSYTKKLMNEGVCYPLNCSEELSEENAAYFDGISKMMKTSSGDIWGIPLGIYFSEVFPFNVGRMEGRWNTRL